MTTTEGARYRPEIDGLRALAVGAVILFHAGVPFLRGGHLGVDVFFVISGYLITGILVRGMARGDFSWRGFYERRARRILPALLVVMLSSSVLASLVMLPDDLENFGQSLVATSLFANNVLLLLTSGYFSLEASFKPLMHTWSLAVEEQYYAVAPIVVWSAYRIGGVRAVAWVTGLVVVASFTFSMWASRALPLADFLLLPSRAWELGVGAGAMLLAEWPGARRAMHGRHAAPWLRSAMGLCGLALIGGAMTFLDPDAAAQPIAALAAVTGTALVLIFGEPRRGCGRWLASRPFVAAGLVSYSAYLYHQPIFAFARITSLDEPSVWRMLALVPLVFAAAALSWRFIEQPCRDRRTMPVRRLSWWLGRASVLVLAAGFVLHVTSGLHARWPELADHDAGFGARQNIAYNMRPYTFHERDFAATSPGTDPPAKLLVIGNSFARDFVNMVLETIGTNALDMSYSDAAVCDVTTAPSRLRERMAHAHYVVLGAGYSDCTGQQLAELRALTTARLAVLGVKNFGWNNNAVMLLPADRRYVYRTKPLAEIVAANADAARKLPPDIYIDILAMLMDAEGRVPVFTPDRKFISQDRIHLTKAGAGYVGALVMRHPALAGLRGARHSEPPAAQP